MLLATVFTDDIVQDAELLFPFASLLTANIQLPSATIPKSLFFSHQVELLSIATGDERAIDNSILAFERAVHLHQRI